MAPKGYFHFLWMGLAILPIVLVAGCGGGGGEGGSGGATSSSSGGGTVSGTAIKGPVSGATVIAYSINANGTRGSQVGSGQTDGRGNFSMSVGNHSGPLMLQMSGGDYMDEATGSQMPVGSNDVMACIISSMPGGSTAGGMQITPLTSMAQSMAQNMSGGMTALNIAQANNAVGRYFGVSDILTTHP